MKATELRIGNYIIYPKYWKDKPIRVTGISVVDRRDDHSGIYEEFLHLLENDFLTSENFDSYIDYKQGVINPLNAQPIEITKEWLLKLGFEHNDYYDNYKVKAGEYYNSVGYNDEYCEWYYNNDSSDAGCYYVTSIKYVHELQNLYFSLNKNELKSKI